MHTPYDGSQPLFRIGLAPLGDAPWLERDERLPVYLAEKDRLLRDHRDAVFGAEPGSDIAQAETLRLIEATLNATAKPDDAPLIAAARLVAEDLALLQKSTEGWRLTAGCICFPSSWTLAEKLGKPLHDVHGSVPDFQHGTRNAAIIERIFDNLRPDEPVIRWNWSVYGNDTLHHPHLSPPRRFGDGEHAESVWLRVERQTLRKLPQSGAVLFTIGVHLTPLEAIEAHPERERLTEGLIRQIEALDEAQTDYKGLSAERALLLGRLRR
ncbi:DUF3445 domain-containing protein [Asticcacaulis sp. AND118]|uniref:heme-dependent oxidative N-demethylase family protein n=1 Tax=Asticcacaulis sp. AND118 TaxID=2840468 RepID=UPI001D0009C0|nr:DUF3445 domain-containing protein [Asticcacaulis sp. AND118]UDF02968.1 DUF3445 domain-containing protein [Asticcacaulis sp. AND118]